MKLIAFLAPIAYLALLLAVVVHEIAGHGLCALALGGTFSGFTIHFDAMGWAAVLPAPGSPIWHQVVILSAGIMTTTLAGAAFCVYAQTRKEDSARGLVLALLGLFLFMDGLPYGFWSAWVGHGAGDPARVLNLLSSSVGERAVARAIWLGFAAILSLLAQWWGIRLVLRHIETRIGQGRPLGVTRRAAALLVFIVIPGIAFWYFFDWEQLAPGIGQLPAHVGALSLFVTAALLARFPMSPFAAPFELKRWHLAGSWAAMGVAVLCVHLWLNEGVKWEGPEDARARARMDLLDQGMKEWKGGRTGDARRTFERLRDDPESGSLGILTLVHFLWDEDELDAAAEAAEEFAARPHAAADEERTSWHLVAMTNERREDWTKAVAAWEKLIPSDAPSAPEWERPIYRFLAIARCRFKLGEVEVAIGLVERCLKDAAVLTPFYRGEPSHAYQASAAYAEYAGRADQLGRARAFAAGLRDPLPAMCRDAIRIVESGLAKDPESVLGAVTGITVHEHVDLAGRLLGEMGAPAIDLLSDRIQAGDVMAIELAACAGRRELLPALEKRGAMSASDADAVSNAIQRVSSVPEPRSTSRQASRRGR